VGTLQINSRSQANLWVIPGFVKGRLNLAKVVSCIRGLPTGQSRTPKFNGNGGWLTFCLKNKCIELSIQGSLSTIRPMQVQEVDEHTSCFILGSQLEFIEYFTDRPMHNYYPCSLSFFCKSAIDTNPKGLDVCGNPQNQTWGANWRLKSDLARYLLQEKKVGRYKSSMVS